MDPASPSPILARLCSFSAAPLGMKKKPTKKRRTHAETLTFAHSPAAAAAASCTGASRIDRSDVPLPLLLLVKLCYFVSEGR